MLPRLVQARAACPCGRSIWVTSPVITALESKPEAGEEHLHLLAGGVLRLVEDDEGVVQRAAAHEGERRDLDRAPLDQLRPPSRSPSCRGARRRAAAGRGSPSPPGRRAGSPSFSPASTAGRARMMRLTCFSCSAAHRHAPSPGRSCRCPPGRCRRRCRARGWRRRSASGRRPSARRGARRAESTGPSTRLVETLLRRGAAPQHLQALLDVLAPHRLSGPEDVLELLHQPHREGHRIGGPGEVELGAALPDPYAQPTLDRLEVLVLVAADAQGDVVVPEVHPGGGHERGVTGRRGRQRFLSMRPGRGLGSSREG